MRSIPLTRGRFALVDDEDYERLSCHKWHLITGTRTNGLPYKEYAARGVYTPKRRTSYMHHEVMGSTQRIDHRDGDGLNNQRSNLRPATPLQNNANSRKTARPKSSIYKGVHYAKHLSLWRAQIMRHGKTIMLGSFFSEEKAAKAYDVAARDYFGSFAKLNFP